MSNLNDHLKIVQRSKHYQNHISSSGLLYRNFQRANIEYSTICRHITAYASFCQPVLTITIPMYITVHCYLLFVVLQRDGTPLMKKTHFLISVVELELFLFYIVFHAAKVVQCHGKMARENRKYLKSCFKSIQLVNQKKKTQSYNQQSFSVLLMLLKAEGLQAPKLFYRYAFTWCGNYRITMKTFHMVYFV